MGVSWTTWGDGMRRRREGLVRVLTELPRGSRLLLERVTLESIVELFWRDGFYARVRLRSGGPPVVLGLGKRRLLDPPHVGGLADLAARLGGEILLARVGSAADGRPGGEGGVRS